MTAEEKLKELYERVGFLQDNYRTPYPVSIKPEDIDLIADLVVERMCKVYNDRIDKALRPNS